MLQPKRSKHRKQQKGRIREVAKRGTSIAFGSFALKAEERANKLAIEAAKSKIISGDFNREKIRELHLKQMDEHRNTLIEYINAKFLLKVDANIDTNDIKKQLAFF
jgi:archaeosine-15-forming tRNA-guanine transglycosylase